MIKKYLATLLLAASLTISSEAAVRLPAILGDNMVLQQQSTAKFWGWASPGATVRIRTSWGENGLTKAGADGSWLVKVRTPEASFEKRSVTISDGQSLTLENILIGEVWLCSGQSNMEIPVQGGRDCPIENSQRIMVESARYPDIRLFSVKIDGSLHPKEDVTGSWKQASPEAVKTFSAVGYLFGRNLRQALDVPIGIINASCGGTWIEAWFPAELQKEFGDYDPASTPVKEGQSGMDTMEILYNGMIYPLRNYDIKGFCWYQGCTNEGRSKWYALKQAALIRHWRDLWGGNSKPFYYVEIAPHENGEENINGALVREQQAKVMDLVENTGMVCTNDLIYDYERWNVHPSRKEPVAERLAWWALSKDYGYGDAVKVIGPRFKSMELLDGGVLKVSFIGGEYGFIIDGPIEGFEVAGADGVFKKAHAERRRPDPTVLYISAYDVGKPLYLRYNFKNCAPGHLWDAFGQPVIPFRTDTFDY
ncbi:MAG: sialate O-acetylesterase [Bacteroidales bacterium]|nr:sialate O-acetylesterase [Bacteroidales bacterium]